MTEQLIGKLLVSGVESFLGPFPMKNEWFIDMKKYYSWIGVGCS